MVARVVIHEIRGEMPPHILHVNRAICRCLYPHFLEKNQIRLALVQNSCEFRLPMPLIVLFGNIPVENLQHRSGDRGLRKLVAGDHRGLRIAKAL